MNKILIIDESDYSRKTLKYFLSKKYNVFEANDSRSALHKFDTHKTPAVILDLNSLPDDAGNGMDCLQDILRINPSTSVIVLIEENNIEQAQKALESGACKYFIKPIKAKELEVAIHDVFHHSNIDGGGLEDRRKKEVQSAIQASFQYSHSTSEESGLYLEQKDIKEIMKTKDSRSEISLGRDNYLNFHGLVGRSPKMIKVNQLIDTVSIADMPVLITGETGTGKELIARAIHMKDAGDEGLFIPINCADSSQSLIEDSIMSQERVANKYIRKYGKLRGTIFFDNVGEMSLPIQVKLLRLMQEKQIQVNEGKRHIAISTRIIASTKVDLYTLVEAGAFREDLYFRLNVMGIKVPPLREREFDVLLLANELLKECNRIYKKESKDFTRVAIDAMMRYEWPGNIRELENRIQSAALTADSKFIDVDDLELPNNIRTSSESKAAGNKYFNVSLKEAKKMLEIDHIMCAADRYNGNIKRMAEHLELSRPTLYDLMNKYNLIIKNDGK